MIKLVTFDALHTLITPRKPIYVQYSEVFAPFLGVLSPSALQRSFKASLKQVQRDKPVYDNPSGARGWWSEVIKRTAIGAGADPQAVEASLNDIVPQLMERFSSSEGYKLFDDTLLMQECVGLQSSRIGVPEWPALLMVPPLSGLVLADLGISPFLRPLVLSEEEGVEKPHAEIFRRTFMRAFDGAAQFDSGVHVGDELHCDYHGARAAGMHSLLIRRPSPDGDQENKRADEDLRNTSVVSSLHDVVDWVKSQLAE